MTIPLRCLDQRTGFTYPVRFLLPTGDQPSPDYFLTEILANLSEFIVLDWRGGNGRFTLRFVP